MVFMRNRGRRIIIIHGFIALFRNPGVIHEIKRGVIHGWCRGSTLDNNVSRTTNMSQISSELSIFNECFSSRRRPRRIDLERIALQSVFQEAFIGEFRVFKMTQGIVEERNHAHRLPPRFDTLLFIPGASQLGSKRGKRDRFRAVIPFGQTIFVRRGNAFAKAAAARAIAHRFREQQPIHRLPRIAIVDGNGHLLSSSERNRRMGAIRATSGAGHLSSRARGTGSIPD